MFDRVRGLGLRTKVQTPLCFGVTLSMAIAGTMHIVYAQFRYRNNVQAIYMILRIVLLFFFSLM